MEKPLVSLIVPVYNVERYLKECLDSICGQTYKKIEIIIVDDGSTDGSHKICEEYVQADSRIKLVRKENGGLSSARNRGIKEASGEYIGFVDSDDQLHKKFVESMLLVALRNNCDIAVCDFTISLNKMNYSKHKIRLLNNTEAISGLLDDFGYKCYAWNKLYRRGLFNDVFFPEGKLFEDIRTIYQLFQKAERIVYIKTPMYYYRQRKGSITKSAFAQENYYLLESIDFLMKDSKKYKEVDRQRILTGYMSYYMGFVRRAEAARADIRDDKERLRKCVKRHIRILWKENNIKIMKKVELIVFAFFPHVYSGVVQIT